MVRDMMFLAWLSWISVSHEFVGLNELLERLSKHNIETTCQRNIMWETLPLNILPPLPQHTDTLEDLRLLRNKTILLNSKNCAYKNSIWLSMLQQTMTDLQQPSHVILSLRLMADISSGLVNSSAVVFNSSKYYPSWVKDFFNKTLISFGLWARRAVDDVTETDDDYQVHPNNSIVVIDTSFLVTPVERIPSINQWFYGPENQRPYLSIIDVRHSIGVNPTYSRVVCIPPTSDGSSRSVQWMDPFIDCQMSRKWILAASAPVVDIIPRHTEYRHLQSYRYVAVCVASVDLASIQADQCDEPEKQSIFSSTHKCPRRSTVCEPLDTKKLVGLATGYRCVCRDGYRLPSFASQSYTGELVETSRSQDLQHQFQCKLLDGVQYGEMHDEELNDYSLGYARNIVPQAVVIEYVGLIRRTIERRAHADKLMLMVNRPMKCSSTAGYRFNRMPSGILYSADEQFEPQTRSALSIAHFLMAARQTRSWNVHRFERNPHASISNLLNEHLLSAELVALLASDPLIETGAIVFIEDEHESICARGRDYAMPASGGEEKVKRRFAVDHINRCYGPRYKSALWYRKAVRRWKGKIGLADLEEFSFKRFYRRSIKVTSRGIPTDCQHPCKVFLSKHSHGYWIPPLQTSCMHSNQANNWRDSSDKWQISYISPFFFPIPLHSNRFRLSGLVRVDLPLSELDIDQCNEHSQNPFRKSNLCQQTLSACVKESGKGFRFGGYRCYCKPGYELTSFHSHGYLRGDDLEHLFEDYKKSQSNITLRRLLKSQCRLSALD